MMNQEALDFQLQQTINALIKMRDIASGKIKLASLEPRISGRVRAEDAA